MSLTSKSHQLDVEQSEEDRFSSLPTSLIGYILSFLPTKDAVATSVLSTTWKEFWTLITRLNFDDELLQRPQNKNRTEFLQAQFVDFVSRVLLVGRFTWIEAFHLRCYRGSRYNPHNVSEWLDSVFNSNVQELDVDVFFKDTNYLVLPRCLYTCRTLVKLKLRRRFNMNVPGSVYFPFLKCVGLFWVRFSDAESITRFLSGCPVLDDLTLLRCIGKDVKVVKISVPSLTSLSLAFLRLKKGLDKGMVDGDAPTLRIVLDTPFLRKIYIYEEAVPHGYVFENQVHQLTSAAIYIPTQFSWGSVVPFKDVHHAAAKDLLKGISKVRNLSISTLATDSGLDLPSFENLKDLEFHTQKKINLQELVKLLEKSPVLSSLSILLNKAVYGRAVERNEEDDMLELDASQSVPNCLLLHLKTVEVEDFRGSNKEVKLAEYFLRNAQVLEKLTMRARGYTEKNRELLLTFPRASRACRIEFLPNL